MFPMGMVTQRMTQGRWRSKLITSSTTWTVPADVALIWIDGSGGGGSGGGGNSTPGGGGGGGGSANVAKDFPFPVTPGETLTITIAAGGASRAAGLDGLTGGSTYLVGSLFAVRLSGGGPGSKGENPNGGGGGYSAVGNGADGPSGGAGAGATTFYNVNTSLLGDLPQRHLPSSPGASGGALNYDGGRTQRFYGTMWVDGAAGGSSGGGGGRGGHGIHGIGGDGGANGAAGNDATGYGAGGGGGSGNSASGAGSSGFIRIYCFTAYSL